MLWVPKALLEPSFEKLEAFVHPPFGFHLAVEKLRGIPFLLANPFARPVMRGPTPAPLIIAAATPALITAVPSTATALASDAAPRSLPVAACASDRMALSIPRTFLKGLFPLAPASRRRPGRRPLASPTEHPLPSVAALLFTLERIVPQCTTVHTAWLLGAVDVGRAVNMTVVPTREASHLCEQVLTTLLLPQQGGAVRTFKLGMAEVSADGAYGGPAAAGWALMHAVALLEADYAPLVWTLPCLVIRLAAEETNLADTRAERVSRIVIVKVSAGGRAREAWARVGGLLLRTLLWCRLLQITVVAPPRTAARLSSCGRAAVGRGLLLVEAIEAKVKVEVIVVALGLLLKRTAGQHMPRHARPPSAPMATLLRHVVISMSKARADGPSLVTKKKTLIASRKILFGAAACPFVKEWKKALGGDFVR